MKCIPYAMKFGTQSRSSSLILSMIFENCGPWSEIKNLDRFGLKIAMCSNFYEIWHLVQIEHAHYEYSTWNWWSSPKIIDSDKFGPNTEICCDSYEIWDSQQIERQRIHVGMDEMYEKFKNLLMLLWKTGFSRLSLMSKHSCCQSNKTVV